MGLDRFVLLLLLFFIGLVKTLRMNRNFLVGWVEYKWLVSLKTYRINNLYHKGFLFRWEAPKLSSGGVMWCVFMEKLDSGLNLMCECWCYCCSVAVCLDSAAVIQFHMLLYLALDLIHPYFRVCSEAGEKMMEGRVCDGAVCLNAVSEQLRPITIQRSRSWAFRETHWANQIGSSGVRHVQQLIIKQSDNHCKLMISLMYWAWAVQ